MHVDGGWGWVVVLGAFVVNFFLVGVSRSLGVVFVMIQQRFDASAAETSLAFSIFISLRSIGGPIGSKLSDRFGCRAVTMTGGLLLCLGLVLTAFATKLIHVYLAMGIVEGIGGMLVISPTYIAISKWFDRNKGKAMALFTIGNGLGGLCMAPLTAILVDNYSYFGTMLIVGALLLNVCVGGALYQRPPTLPTIAGTLQLEGGLPEEQTTNSTTSEETSDNVHQHILLNESTTTQAVPNGNGSILRSQEVSNGVLRQGELQTSSRCCTLSSRRSSLWTNVPFICHCVTVSAFQICNQCVIIFLPTRACELGTSSTSAALLLTLFGAFDMGGRFFFGFVFDLPQVRRRRVYVYTALATSFGAGAVLLSAAENYVLLAVTTCFVAMVEGGAHSQRATSVTELVDKSQMSTGVGLVIFAQGIGNFFGPLAGGVLKDITGAFSGVFMLGGSVLSSVCILTTTVKLALRLRCPGSHVTTRTFDSTGRLYHLATEKRSLTYSSTPLNNTRGSAIGGGRSKRI